MVPLSFAGEEFAITQSRALYWPRERALLVADLPQGPMPQPPAAFAGPVPRTFLPAPPQKTNGKAIASMVCGILCVATGGLTGLPAVILGHQAQSEIRRTGEGGDGFAVTGLVLGWLSVAAWVLIGGLVGLVAVLLS